MHRPTRKPSPPPQHHIPYWVLTVFHKIGTLALILLVIFIIEILILLPFAALVWWILRYAAGQ